MLGTRRVTTLAVVLCLAFCVSSTRAAPRTKLIVMVIEDDRPSLGARVVIKPTGMTAGWPKGKDQIELYVDFSGRAWTRLGPGQYLVTAYQSIGSKVPADTLVTIPPLEHTRPILVRLVLQYWDCANVTCEI
jgi:hypothetical protein